MERAQRGERTKERRACERGIWVEGKLAYEIKGAGDSPGDGGRGRANGRRFKIGGVLASKHWAASAQAQYSERTSAESRANARSRVS